MFVKPEWSIIKLTPGPGERESPGADPTNSEFTTTTPAL
jgi:hypothetical protein